MPNITIRDIRAICTAPAGNNLTVVKVETSEPGLYGLGCSTFAYRHKAVACVVEEYLKPLLIGRDVSCIEDIWQVMHFNAYWRNGPISNNAISGIDMALWDIKGKIAGMPLFDLLGGKCREAVSVYRHADAPTLKQLMENIFRYRDEGVRHVRVQWCKDVNEGNQKDIQHFSGCGYCFDPAEYCRSTAKMFEYLRGRIGDEIELIHDVHERIAPSEAMRLAKYLEPFRLFFLEDLLPPEQSGYFQIIRQQSAVPLAQGELFNHPLEWEKLIADRLIDFIRVHISQLGGITPARKLAVFCERFGVRTAWHGPGDVSPVGHAANIHLDMCSPNFGIQEWTGFNDVLLEVFPGCPELKKGYVYPNEKPGLGIDIDEKSAAKYPCRNEVTMWTQMRLRDGTFQCP